MKLIGIVRLGRDAEVRYAANGDAVAGFSGAFDYGRKGDDGRRPSQWVDFALWGKRAEALAPYLLKGKQCMVVASDVHIEHFDKRDGGQGVKLTARVDDLQLVGSRDGEAAAPAPAPAQRQAAPAPAAASRPASRPSTAFDDMDDDLPF